MELLRLYLSPIEKSKTRFKVIVTNSPVGEGDTESKVPFREGRVDRRNTLLKSLEAISFRSQDFPSGGEQDWMVQAHLITQDRIAFHPKRLVNIGQVLYRTLFPSATRVENVLRKSLARAEENNTQLHIQLQFAPDNMQLIRLPDYPWELMHDGQRFLAHHHVSFSRYIAYEAVPPNLSGSEQINVLLVSSTAFDEGYEQLSSQEQEAIRQGLKATEKEQIIHLDQLKNANIEELRAYLTEHRGINAPHVFHFDGHGCFGQRCSNEQCRRFHKGTKTSHCKHCGTPLSEVQGYLLFEDKKQGANYVSAEELGVLLHQSSFSDDISQQRGIALVVLSACQSALSLSDNSVFNGVAQSLINHRIPAVVAMQYKVTVSSASAFAKQFYRSLGQKDSLALAVSKGREAMGVEDNQWYRPVLYLRWKDNEGGQLFTTSLDPALPKVAPDIEIVIQNLLHQLATTSYPQPLVEITNEIEKLTMQARSLKLAKMWLAEENFRWNLALKLGNTVLQKESLGVYSTQKAKEDAVNEFIINLFTCIYWLFDSFQTGHGKDIDNFKESLTEHPLSMYANALYILKLEAQQYFGEHQDVLELVYDHIDCLIKKILT